LANSWEQKLRTAYGDRQFLFNGYRGSVKGDRKVLEVGGDGGHTTLLMLCCTLVEMVNFLLCIFYHNKKINNKKGNNPKNIYAGEKDPVHIIY
jgi:hypothetical protein